MVVVLGAGEGEISISDLLIYIHLTSLVRSCVDMDKNPFQSTIRTQSEQKARLKSHYVP